MYTSLSIFLFGFIIKSHNIHNGNYPIWDEAHFGKYAHNYLKNTFYFDVHPPLGKLLIAICGYFFKQMEYDNLFSEDEFPESFNYIGMRRFHAIFGSLTNMIFYKILRILGFSKRRSILGTFLIIFENGFLTIERLVVLDSYLLFFTLLSIYFMIRLYKITRNELRNKNINSRSEIRINRIDLINEKINQKNKDDDLIKNLIYLGTSIGLLVSVKWIGLLTIFYIGLVIIYDLYMRIVLNVSFYKIIKRFIQYFLFLIILPISIYISLFYIHFLFSQNSSPDDGFMSTKFQLGIKNNIYKNTNKYIYYGNQITIKTNNKYLHSHKLTYPGMSSKQVTGYEGRDENNVFYFKQIVEDIELEKHPNIEYKDDIALYHDSTETYLSFETINGELLLTGVKDIDDNSMWKILKKKNDSSERSKVLAIYDNFVLKNSSNDMYIRILEEKLPLWGAEQFKVTLCNDVEDATEFLVEENFHSLEDEETEKINIEKPGFFYMLYEYHKKMYKINKSFVQDPSLEPDKIVSKAWEWPILTRGIRMTQWWKKHKIYFMFNPVTLYSSTIFIILSPVISFLYKILNKKKRKNDRFLLYIIVFGYMVHYLIFLKIERVLYIHHYLTPYFFAILSISYVMNFFNIKYLYILVFLSIISFFIYSPLSYGTSNTESLRSYQIFKSWNFVD